MADSCRSHVRQASLTRMSSATARYINVHNLPSHQRDTFRKTHSAQSSFSSTGLSTSSGASSGSHASFSSATSLEQDTPFTKASQSSRQRLYNATVPNDRSQDNAETLEDIDDGDNRWSQIITDLGIPLQGAQKVSQRRASLSSEEEIVLGYAGSEAEAEVDSDSDTEPFSPSKRTSELAYRRPTYSWIVLSDANKPNSSKAGSVTTSQPATVYTKERRPMPVKTKVSFPLSNTG